jgi:EmrB/QacA subfamily drug resistance transporter
MTATSPATVERPAPSPPAAAHENRWRLMIVLSLVQFMLYLDDTIVNVALPSIKQDLGFSQTSLAWVANAYVLIFGGFLLLGGRLADLLDHKRVFMVGLGLFSVASLVNGLAPTSGVLLVSRGIQGLGAALAAPAALALTIKAFVDEREKATALGVWGGLSGAGAAAGVIFGGVIVDLVDWRWIFFINLPIAVVAAVFVGRIVRASDVRRSAPLDVAGAVTGTAGVMIVVYTLLSSDKHDWLSAWTLGGFALGAAVLALFAWIEHRSSRPLVPLEFFTHRRRNTAFGLQVLLAAVLFGAFFLGTLYMQQVLGLSPLQGGMAWLGFFAGAFPAFAVGTMLVLRAGVRPVIVSGLLVAAGGFAWLTRIPVDGGYFADVLPGMLLLGVGLGFALIAVSIAALAEAADREAGLAAGVLKASHQLGGALGLSVLAALAVDRAKNLGDQGVGAHAAQVAGTHTAFAVAGALCAVGALLTIALIGRLRPTSVPDPTVSSAVAIE